MAVPAAAPVAGKDFTTCALDKALGTSTDSGAGTGPRSSRPVLASATAAPLPSACKSIYTVQVAAKIPQPRLVDPSIKAPYQVNSGGGYNPTTNHPHALSPGFPACFSAAEVAADTAAGATAEWYTYIKGGKLGSVSASFAWNRKAQEVHVVDGPTISTQKLTRIFVWRMKIHGSVKHGSCPETNEVPVLTLPVGGADVPSSLSPREFSLITVWGFPFEPTGVRVDPSTLVERGKNVLRTLYYPLKLYDKAIEKLVGLLPFYHSLNKFGRFAVEFGASYLLGTKFVKAVGAAPAVATKFFEGAKYLPQVIAGLEAAETLSHRGHSINSLREFLGFVSGLAAEGEYPVMGAVIRGRFLVSGYAGEGNLKVPLDSMLGVSVKTTNFPTISVKVSRAAEANLDPNNKVTTGLLPWGSMASSQLDIFNKLTSNPSYLLTNAATTHYADGVHGIHELHADTSQTPVLTAAVERKAEEETEFDAEASEAALPDCGAFTGIPAFGTTVCYTFSDGKP